MSLWLVLWADAVALNQIRNAFTACICKGSSYPFTPASCRGGSTNQPAVLCHKCTVIHMFSCVFMVRTQANASSERSRTPSKQRPPAADQPWLSGSSSSKHRRARSASPGRQLPPRPKVGMVFVGCTGTAMVVLDAALVLYGSAQGQESVLLCCVSCVLAKRSA